MKLIVIVGATATGKTRLAVEVAHELGAEVLSADSRQVYRGLDLGTGKDLDEYASVSPPVPYHLIDVVDPGESYTLFRYQRDCYRILARAWEAGRGQSDVAPFVMVGGTALYALAVLLDYRIPDVPEDAALRAALAGRDLADLAEKLRRAHPRLYEETDRSTKRRVIRALEVAAAVGDGPIPYAPSLPFELRYDVYAVRMERDAIHRRIALRLEQRLEAGMVDEVRRLLDAGVSAEWLKRLGLEYAQITAHLLGEKSYEAMKTDLRHAINNFAKRQETWFRGFETKRGIPITWIDPGDVAAISDVG